MDTAYYSLRLRLWKHLGETAVKYGVGVARIDKETDYLILFSLIVFDSEFCEKCVHSNIVGGRVPALEDGREIELNSLNHPDFGSLRIASSPRREEGTPSEGEGYKYTPQEVFLAPDGLPSRFLLNIKRKTEEGVFRFERVP
jgi:hypothetical protein